MSIRRSVAARFAVVIPFLVTSFLVSDPARATSREEAESSARSFLGAFLEEDAGAARYATGNLREWRTVLNRHLPGPGEFSGYEILSVKGSSKARKAAARVTRGESTQIFYLQLNNEGKITDFYTMAEALRPMVEELRRVTDRISGIDLNADSYAEIEALMLEQQRVASRIKNLLWRHRQLLGAE